MDTKEDDPDILQLLDELDIEWTKRWRNLVNKKQTCSEKIHFSTLPLDKAKVKQ